MVWALSLLLAAALAVCAALAVVVGALPGLATLSFMNHLKFDTWSPLSYGPRVSEAGEWTQYLPVAVLGLLFLVGVRLGLEPRVRERLRGRALWTVAALGGAAVAVLALPEMRELLARLVRGVGTLLVDLRWYPSDIERPALARSASGGLVYFGHVKKAWAQSLPYLGLLALPGVAMLRGHADRGRLAALCLVPGSYLAAFGYFAWDGGLGLNLRYLAPALPFVAILTAWALRLLWGGGAGVAPWVSGWLAVVAYWALSRAWDGSPESTETVVLGVPLGIAGVCAGTSLLLALRGERAGSLLRAGTGAAAAAALVWAGLVAFTYDYPAARWLRGYNATLSTLAGEVVRPDSIVFTTHPDPFCGLLDAERVRIALPRRDRFADQRLGERHQPAAAGPLQDARRRQRDDVGGQSAEHRGHHEDRQRHDHQPPAAEDVAEPAVDRGGDGRGDEIGHHHPGQAVDLAERGGDGRQRRRHDRLIDDREEHRQDDRGKDGKEAAARTGGRRGLRLFGGRFGLLHGGSAAGETRLCALHTPDDRIGKMRRGEITLVREARDCATRKSAARNAACLAAPAKRL